MRQCENAMYNLRCTHLDKDGGVETCSAHRKRNRFAMILCSSVSSPRNMRTPTITKGSRENIVRTGTQEEKHCTMHDHTLSPHPKPPLGTIFSSSRTTTLLNHYHLLSTLPLHPTTSIQNLIPIFPRTLIKIPAIPLLHPQHQPISFPNHNLHHPLNPK